MTSTGFAEHGNVCEIHFVTESGNLFDRSQCLDFFWIKFVHLSNETLDFFWKLSNHIYTEKNTLQNKLNKAYNIVENKFVSGKLTLIIDIYWLIPKIAIIKR